MFEYGGKRKTRGFTLIELLVVISIIALLLSIMMPALQKVKEQGRSIVCANFLKTLGLSNAMYASEWKDYSVPISQFNPASDWGQERWVAIEEFRALIDVNARKNSSEMDGSDWNDPYIWPVEYLCPSSKIPKTQQYLDQMQEEFGWKLRVTYAINCDGRGFNEPYTGFKVTASNASSKLCFYDSVDWMGTRDQADYKSIWDVYGDVYKQETWGSTAYRHKEGINICYLDGHIGYLPKEKVYYYDQTVDSDKNDELWKITGGSEYNR